MSIPALSPARDALQESLNKRDIQTGIHYPIPVHLLPAYEDLNYRAGDFPVSERVAAQELSLPMYPEMPTQSIETVCEAVAEILQTEQPVAHV